MKLKNGWNVGVLVDDDGHLNIYITCQDGSDIKAIDTGQGDGHGEQLAYRLTTDRIEAIYIKEVTP